jgi:hypothetical protein
MGYVKGHLIVVPAKAGTQYTLTIQRLLVARLRGHDNLRGTARAAA